MQSVSHNIHFDVKKSLIIINKLKNMFLNTVFKEFLIHNKVKYNEFCNILNIETDFKYNDTYIYTYTRQYLIFLQMFYVWESL